MLYKYIKGMFKSDKSFDHVIHITKEQLKAIKSLVIDHHIYDKVEKINLGFQFAPISKYDFSNIRSLCKTLYCPLCAFLYV